MSMTITRTIETNRGPRHTIIGSGGVTGVIESLTDGTVTFCMRVADSETPGETYDVTLSDRDISALIDRDKKTLIDALKYIAGATGGAIGERAANALMKVNAL